MQANSSQDNQTELLVAIKGLSKDVEYIKEQVDKLVKSQSTSEGRIDELFTEIAVLKGDVAQNTAMRNRVNGALFTGIASLLGLVSFLVYYITGAKI